MSAKKRNRKSTEEEEKEKRSDGDDYSTKSTIPQAEIDSKDDMKSVDIEKESPTEDEAPSVRVDKASEMSSFFLIIPLWRTFLRPPSWIARIVLIVIAVLCCFLAAYQIFNLLSSYVKYEMKVSTHYEYSERFPFPAISLCTNSRINATKLEKYQIPGTTLDYMLSSFLGYSTDNSTTSSLEKTYEDLKQNVPNLGNNLEKFYLENGFDCSQFLDKCQFQGKSMNCCAAVVEEYLTSTGKCFKLQVPGRQQNIPGQMGGLKIEARNRREAFPLPDIANGMELRIQDKGGPVSRTMLSPGSYNLIQMKRDSAYSLGNPFSNCRDETGYSQEQCIGECMGQKFFTQCACTPIGPHKDMINGYGRLCTPFQVKTCVNRILKAIDNDSDNCNCGPACEATFISTFNSFTAFGSEMLAEKVIVDVFFPEFVQKRTEDYPAMTAVDLFGDIGLVIVVFTGLSLLTLLQSFFYFIFGCCLRNSSKVEST